VRGCEALLRWRHPERGLMSPATFIPIAEESFLIVAIGRWVLQQATRDLARWRAEGHTDLYVSVNVSARQLLDVGPAGRRRRRARRVRRAGSALVVELTESALVVNPDDGAGHPRRTAQPGLRAGRRRLRHRLLRAVVPAPLPGDSRQDRPAFVSLPGVDTALVSAILRMAYALA
jgi:EAL domain-containing protein (putative c-di-GMP-specific phosphodiesterase class I)